MKQWFKKMMQSPWEKRIFPLCLILGVIFLLFSNTHVSEPQKKDTEKSPVVLQSYEEQLETRLEETLSFVEGAGRVKVMLILKDQGKVHVEKETAYNTVQSSEEDAGGGNRTVTEENMEESVIYDNDSDPFISMEETPSVQGALVLAEGAESSIVQQQLLQSVSVLLDLSVSEIQILPYKNES